MKVRALVVSAASCLSACTHVLHPAHVQPGWQVELGGGTVLPEYRPGANDVPPGAVPARFAERGQDVQLAVGYGKRFSGNVALLAQLTTPLTQFDAPYEDDSQSVPGLPALDVYLQLVGGGVDAGVGAIATVAPSAYVEMGKRGRVGSMEWSVDVGVRGQAGSTTAVSPFSLLTARHHRWTLGAWADAMFYDGGRFEGCEDCVESDWLQRRVSFGALVRWTPGASR